MKKLSVRSRAQRYARQRGADPGRAVAVSVVAEGLLSVHGTLPPEHRGILTPRQRRRLQHKYKGGLDQHDAV